MLCIKKLARVVCGLFVILSMSGCVERLQTGQPVTSLGEFEFESGLTLSVVDNEGIIDYSLIDESGNRVIKSNQRASIFQRWMIVWDGDILWFSSGDIGSVAWVKVDGSFTSKDINKIGDLKGNMPREIMEFIKR
ncbi:hypothetical protein KCM76_17155 [Zooshikella marina]|uniref:hypothetical protein n=1 Tax=Zooshikella ganghwensis TaxID=202772 RepID=UPI00040D2BEF|nr:hypothetical protein [Zooshikella ganghwensis]MBU2707724.1 hypothetical protein [Zooshikella ganghwensis]